METEAKSMELSLEKLTLASSVKFKTESGANCSRDLEKVNETERKNDSEARESDENTNRNHQDTINSNRNAGSSGANFSAARKQPVVPQDHKQSGSDEDPVAKSLLLNAVSEATAAIAAYVQGLGSHGEGDSEQNGNDPDDNASYDEDYDDYDDYYESNCSIHDVCEYDSDTDQISY